MKQNVRILLQATAILLALGITVKAQPTRVTAVPNASTNFFTAGDFVYFTADGSLWRTDGTDAGTITLTSALTGPLSAFTEFNDMLIFLSGNELWRSDGTPGGTVMLTTKNELQILQATEQLLFFSASDAATGTELYRTDGTSAGTTMVEDINPGSGDGFIGSSAVAANKLFFRGNNGVNGDEPWASDGTAAGTAMIEDINPGSGSGFSYGSPYGHGSAYGHNGLFYFTGFSPDNGREPWVSDGTAAGTFMLAQTEPGTVSPSWILWGIGHDGTVYFIVQSAFRCCSAAENSTELWKTTGTTASTVSLTELHPEYLEGDVNYQDPFRIYKNKVYFFSHATVGDGPHFLWVSDGTSEGTYQVENIGDYRSTATFAFFEVVGDYMIFNVSADGNPSDIYRSDGTAAGTGPWYRPNSATQMTRVTPLTEVGDLLFYPDHDGPVDEGGNPLNPDDYYHLFENDGETWQSIRTMYGVSTIGTANITDYNGIVAFTTQNDQDGSTDTQKYLWTYDPNNSAAIVGSIEQEVWNGVPGTKVSDIPVEEPPSSVRELSLFETPSNIGDNYGSRVRGYLIPPETRSYTFWIASDDQGELWLSSDMDPANKVKIAAVNGWTNPRQWDKYPSQKSASIILYAGEKYYVEALVKEGSGRDHLAVGWSFGQINEMPIPGNRLMPFEGNILPAIAITSPEDGDTFTSGSEVTITAEATDEDGTIAEVEFYNGPFFLGDDDTAPYVFNWNARLTAYPLIAKAIDNDGGVRRDTVRISVTRAGTCAGAGMIRQEFWTNVAGTRVSDIPLEEEPDFIQNLTIFEGPASAVGDNYGSRIRGYICPPASGEYTFWIAGDDQVELWLSTDDDPANKRRIAYHTGWTQRRQWDRYATQQSVAITLQANQRYYVEALMKEASGADHVSVGWQLPNGALQRPIAGSHLIPFDSSEEPPTACAGTGTISVETWTNIDGTRVSSIPVNTSPDLTGTRTLFEAPTNVGSNFGSRFRGYICVPATGNYTFWIASDDHSELWLSTDDDPANKRLIANVWGWTTPRQWDKYSTQQSAPISLVAGQQYYIEALYKEDEGGDNMAVGWRLPNGTMERPIPGNRLSPFDGGTSTMAARTSTEQELYQQISVYPNPVRSGDAQLTISGYEGIDKAIETNVQIMNMTGDVVFSERVLCGGNCGSYLMKINEQLVPGVYLVNMETNGVRTAKRLLVK